MPLLTLSFGVRIVFQNPRYITCYDMFEKMFVIFDAFKKVQAHIPSIFHLFIGENFWDQLGTNHLHAQFEGQNFMDGLAIQIQQTTDQSVKRRSDLTRSLTLVTFSSVFDVQRSSRTRFVFHTLTATQKCFMPPKNLCP